MKDQPGVRSLVRAQLVQPGRGAPGRRQQPARRPPSGQARLQYHEGGMDAPPFALLGAERRTCHHGPFGRLTGTAGGERDPCGGQPQPNLGLSLSSEHMVGTGRVW